uniref:Thyrotropin-releasing hormone receptor n=1 Tax=Zeugodacus cucurbitae TaxID=28588 RepID=A0A0A1WMD6_ZEUCU
MVFTSADVAAVRHVVQRILVPCVFVVGLLGNSVSIYVLTRKRMRCTTNIYLTALAITDIIYLTMALLLSLKHYDYVQRNVEIFWKCYGYVVWLCDACAYISIYIAVCFTIERFIAIRYPLKRQTFCTESLAKKVITGVVLFCLFSTISTAFEHQYSIAKKSIDIHGVACNKTQANAPERLTLLQLNYNESVRQQQQQQADAGSSGVAVTASGSGATGQLCIQTSDGADGQEANIPAEVIQAGMPSPGGTRRVVLLLQDGTYMMTEMHDDEYTALNIAA